jgi:NADH-quinone oxidoreductase subunit E
MLSYMSDDRLKELVKVLRASAKPAAAAAKKN